MFTSPHDCGLYMHTPYIIGSSTDPELLYLAEWLCPLCPSKHFLLDTPMLVHDMPFNLPTLSMDQEVKIFKTTFLYVNAI